MNDDIPHEMTVAGQDDSTKSGSDTTGSVADLFSKRKYMAIYCIWVWKGIGNQEIPGIFGICKTEYVYGF